MVSQETQSICVLTAFLGWLGVITACSMPQWKVTLFVGTNIVTTHVIWVGIWMTCAVQRSGQIECKVCSYMPALSPDLQIARAMIIVSIFADANLF